MTSLIEVSEWTGRFNEIIEGNPNLKQGRLAVLLDDVIEAGKGDKHNIFLIGLYGDIAKEMNYTGGALNVQSN